MEERKDGGDPRSGGRERGARRRGQDRAGEPRRHDDRILRFLHLRHGGGAGVRRHVLPEIRAGDPDAQRLSDLRHRLPRPAGRLVPVRPFRRPDRAQVDPRRHHADHGPRDHPDRRLAGLCDRRRARAVAARRPAVPPGRRPRRRMGRRRADRGRKRPRRAARLVRHVPPARAADRLLHRDRPLSPPPRRVRRKGLRRLGVAHPFPHERRAGRDRPLRADLARGDACLQGGARRGFAGRRAARGGPEEPLAAAHPGLAVDRRLLRPVLYRDGLCAGLRRPGARHSARELSRDAVRRNPLHGRRDAGFGGAGRPGRQAARCCLPRPPRPSRSVLRCRRFWRRARPESSPSSSPRSASWA